MTDDNLKEFKEQLERKRRNQKMQVEIDGMVDYLHLMIDDFPRFQEGEDNGITEDDSENDYFRCQIAIRAAAKLFRGIRMHGMKRLLHHDFKSLSDESKCY